MLFSLYKIKEIEREKGQKKKKKSLPRFITIHYLRQSRRGRKRPRVEKNHEQGGIRNFCIKRIVLSRSSKSIFSPSNAYNPIWNLFIFIASRNKQKKKNKQKQSITSNDIIYSRRERGKFLKLCRGRF